MNIKITIYILISIAHLASSVTNNSYECVNPINKLGVCISLYTCPTVLKLFLNSPGSPDDERFLETSYCENGFGAAPFVCCSHYNSFSNQPKKIKNDLPSSREECTQDSYLSLAVWKLTYLKAHCIGALINPRYVLTSGWCAANARKEILRLGKSNIDNIRIEKRIVHESYTYSDDYVYDHDIGLLRLSRSVPFNEDIAPICLPSVVTGVQHYKIGDSIQFPVRSGNDVTLKRGGNIVAKCKDNKNPSPSQLCVTGDISSYYWSFEYGAPLVIKYGGAWVVDGVYGFHNTQSFALFSKISVYENWIRSNLEP